MEWFETGSLALPENWTALADLNSQWIDRLHDRNELKYIVLDMDSSVSPTQGKSLDLAARSGNDCVKRQSTWVMSAKRKL